MEKPANQNEKFMAVRIAAALRAVARVWSLLVFLLALILIFGSRNAPTSVTAQNGPLDFLIPFSLLLSLVGLGVAFRWESWGVLINFTFYLAIVPLYWLLHGEWVHFSILIGLSPVILPGILFAAAWALDRKTASA